MPAVSRRLTSTSLLNQLGGSFHELCFAVAFALDAVCADLGRILNAGGQPEFPQPDEILKSVGERAVPAGAFVFDGLSEFERQAATHRIIRICHNALVGVDGPNPALRPSVLRLAAEALSNPEFPATLDVALFVAIQELRRRYSIAYEPVGYGRIRQAYDKLIQRARSNRMRVEAFVDGPADSFLLDAVCLGGWGSLFESGPSREKEADSFATSPLGVDDRGIRNAYTRRDLHLQIAGSLPSFGQLTTFIFGQPTGVPGLDFVTGGILAPFGDGRGVQAGGLITLIAGPPGSGKTNLSLAIAYRMAELGSSVRYLTVEESPEALIPRVLTSENVLAAEFAPFIKPTSDSRRVDFRFVQPKQDETFADLIRRTAPSHERVLASPDDSDLSVVVPLRMVLVIDSLTTLLEKGKSAVGDRAGRMLTRREIADVLDGLRNLGVCVLLVGSAADPENSGLAYLVDNVLALEAVTDDVTGHTRRSMFIEKTRLQNSTIGRHPFEIRGTMSCVVAPSLTAWLGHIEQAGVRRPSQHRLRSVRRLSQQLPLTGFSAAGAIDIRDDSHILVYGQGPAGKAKFALSIAFESAIDARELHPRQSGSFAARRLIDDTKVLLLSFLYESAYYEDAAATFLTHRYKMPPREARGRAGRQLHFVGFTPGFIDAETIVARVDAVLRRAELSGHPFTAVVIDGLHNLLVQFPRVETEDLFVPTLLRLLRTRQTTVITTFTDFALAGLNRGDGPRENATPVHLEMFHSPGNDRIRVTHQVMYHLLVSGMDYTFLVQKPSDTSDVPNERCVRVELVQALEPPSRKAQGYWWNVDTMTPVLT